MKTNAKWVILAAALLILLLVGFLGSCDGGELAEIEGLPEAEGGMRSEMLAVSLKESSVGGEGITYFETEGINSEFFAPAESDEELAVTAFGPEGELPVEMKRPDIYLAFNQPMIPLARLGESNASHPQLSIEPAIEGTFRWYGSRLLAFEPAEALEGQRAYRVTLKKGIRSLGGKQLAEDLSFGFHTEYLDFVRIYPGRPEDFGRIDPNDAPPAEARFITCEFTYPVDLEYLSRHLQVRAGGIEQAFSVARPEEEMPEDRLSRHLLLTLEKELPEDTEIRVILKAGASSGGEYLERPTDSVLSFHTLKPFAFKRLRTYSYSFPRSDKGDANPVYLEFSHPLEEEGIARYLSTDLDVADMAGHVEVWRETLKLNNLPVDYESVYRIFLDAGIRDIHGRTLAEPEELEVEVGPATRYYYFPDSGSRMLEAQFDPKIIYEYQNVFDGDWHIASIEDPYSRFGAETLTPYDFSSLKKNTKHYEVLDLAPYLNNEGYGAVGLAWNFGEKQNGERRSWEMRNLQVQVTDIGITTRYAFNKVLVWAASLESGEALKGATVELLRNRSVQRESVTDESGLALFELEPGEYRRLFKQGSEDVLRIRVSRGTDRAEFIPNGSHNQYHFGIYSTARPMNIEEERMEAFIFTDRGLYKKGETVTFRGIDRSWSAGEYTAFQGPYSIEVAEQRYRAEAFRTLEGKTTASGGFYGSFDLPEDLEPGSFWIIYRRGSHEQRIPFTVAEFRRAAFEVGLSVPEREYYAGDSISIGGKARFLSGGDLAGGAYSALWMREPAAYQPPGREWADYRFAPYRWGGTRVVSEETGALDGSGSVLLSQASGADQIPGIPYRYRAELAVQDQARQELAARSSVLVHPASFYVGARFDGGEEGFWSTFVKSGEEIPVEAVLVSPDGTALKELPGGSAAVLFKRSWQVSRQQGVYGRLNNRYELVEEEVEEYGIAFKNGRARFTVTPPEAGEYLLRLSAADEAGREVISEISFYATGSSYVQWNQSDPKDIELIPDKDEYRPGETARLLVKSPVERGSYLLTIEREGIIEERIIDLEGSAASIEIPVEEGYLPVVYAALSSYTRRGEAPTSYFDPDLGKPRGLFGITRLKVSPESRSLQVTMEADKELYRPGSEGRVRIKVTSGGRPVEGAEVTFLAVDRGVVDLIDYHVPDPMQFFYADYKFPLGVFGADSRSLLINPVTYEVKDLQGGDGDEGKLERRKEFSPLAVFEPYLVTGADGSVEAVFTFPDTLTTYRSTAVAVDRNRFGRLEDELKVQNPITVRTALPRKLRLRDTARSGVVVTNLDGRVQSLTITCRALSGGIELAGETEKKIELDPGESREVPFTLLAKQAGEARLEFELRSALLSEVLESSLTVERPLVSEAFTLAGMLDAGASDTAEEGLVIPAAVAPDFGDLTLRVSPNPVAGLNNTVERLLAVDYEILEGEMFRFLPHLVLGEKVEIFDTVYDEQGLLRFLSSLRVYQNRDGGFGYKAGSGYSSAYLSARLAHYLILAEERGLAIANGPDRERLLGYLKKLYADEEVADHTRFYSLYLRSLMGDYPEDELAESLERGDEIGLGGYGFLSLSYAVLGASDEAGRILSRMLKFIKLGTRSLDIAETYEARFYFDSELTQLSLLLMALYAGGDPAELLDKAARTLIDRQRYGRWGSLNDAAWVLISYGERFREFLMSDGRLDAEVRLGDLRLLSASSADPEPVAEVYPLFAEPLAGLERNTLLPLTFSRSGEAPLFYSGTIRYALPAETAQPRDEGFSVLTRLETLDGEEVDSLVAGETYRMRVSFSTARDRSMCLLRVPVPSGCEIVDANLVTTRSYAEEGGGAGRSFERETVYGDRTSFVDEGYYYPDSGYFASLRPERKILDNEARFYFRHIYAGRESLDFLIRATGRGIFPTPPAKIQGIYEEEVFGRGAGRLIIIE